LQTVEEESVPEIEVADAKPVKRLRKDDDLLGAERRLAYMLVAPTFILMLAIMIYPFGQVFYASMTDRVFASAQETSFVGLDNYRELLSLTVKTLGDEVDENGNPVIDEETGEVVKERPIDVLPREPRYREAFTFGFFGTDVVIGATDRDFIRSVWDTSLFTVAAVILETLLGLGIALLLNGAFVGRGAMRALMLVPWAVPTAVSSRMWEYMFSSTRSGLFNVLGQNFFGTDGQTAWLANPSLQLPAAIAIDVWKTTPFMALLMLAGLQLIPDELYEAARVDGANRWRQLTSVTLPLLKPTIAVALVFRTLDSLRVFDLFQIVFGQNRFTMASKTYYDLIDNQLMGYSSASSVVIFLLLTVFAIIYIRTLGVSTDE